jgi:uncharacterized protein YkwD
MSKLAARRAAIAVTLAGMAVGAGALLTPGTALAAPTSSAAPTSWDTAIVSMINSERKASKVAALKNNSELAKAAAAHSKDMAKYNNLVPREANEPIVPKQLAAAGYKVTHWAANLGSFAGVYNMTETGAKAVQTYLFSQKKLRTIILDKAAKDVGVGIYLDTVHKTLWLTEFTAAR